MVDSVTSDSIAGARINHEKGMLITTGVDGLSPMVEVLPGEYGVRVKAEGYEGVEQYHLKVALNQSPQRIKIPLVSLTTR